jgi:hypothetical protein
MCPTSYPGMKWLKEKAVFWENELGKLYNEVYEYFSNMLERQSYDCYIAACIEFGTATRKVHTPLYSFQLRIIFLANFVLSAITNAKSQSRKTQKPCVLYYAPCVTRLAKTCHSSTLSLLVEMKILSH